MNLENMIELLARRIATLSQRLAHAQITGDLEQVVALEQEIADAALAIDKLKA